MSKTRLTAGERDPTLPDEPTAAHAEQQALHALPADRPATPGVARLTILALRHWQAHRQSVVAIQPWSDGHHPAALRAVT